MDHEISRRQPGARWRATHLWALSPGILTLLIVVVGVVFERHEGRDSSLLGLTLVWVLFFLHVPLAIILWRRAHEVRWGSLMASAVFGLVSLVAGFVSLLKIGGDSL